VTSEECGEPEIDPAEAQQYEEVVATRRSDFPNQINNVLTFPGVFRGLLDARSTDITPSMPIAAARALSSLVGDDKVIATYITRVCSPPTFTAGSPRLSGPRSSPEPMS
jgi:malate dehydrogenase (oxaloacetate-decarboxylating)